MNNVVRFKFEAAGSPSMRERVFDSPSPELINMSIGTTIEVNFEGDCYFADFKIDSKNVSQLTNNNGEEITEYVYSLKYIPKTTKTKTEYEQAKEQKDAMTCLGFLTS